MTHQPRHPVEILIDNLSSVEPYPPKVVKVEHPHRIAGTAFFPGGHGLWAPQGGLPNLPARPVMLLGNNWGIVSDHEVARVAGAENMADPTWRNLLRILELAAIPPTRCFFTNVFMGLMDGDRNVDEFPGLRDKAFCERCSEFLRLQLRVIAPSVVVAMGSVAISMLSGASGDLASWRGPKGGELSFKAIEESRSEVVRLVRVEGVTAHFAAVAMKHPCFAVNLSRGFQREAGLLRSAIGAAAIAG